MLNFTSCVQLLLLLTFLFTNYGIQKLGYKNATSFFLCLLRTVALLALAAEI